MEEDGERALIIETDGLGANAMMCETPGLAVTGEALLAKYGPIASAKALVNGMRADLDEDSAVCIDGIGTPSAKSNSLLLDLREVYTFARATEAERIYIHYQGIWRTSQVRDRIDMKDLLPLADAMEALRRHTTVRAIDFERSMNSMTSMPAVAL